MPNHATLDYETRSEVNLLNVGAYKYAEHPSTSILWMAYNLGDGTKLWWHTDPDPEDLFEWIEDGGLIEAHNSFFEHCIWNMVATRDFMWPEMPIEQWRCSMAKCRYNSIPGALEKAGSVLGLDTQKDKRGKQLIKLLSVPRKIAKGKMKKWVRDLEKYEHQDLFEETTLVDHMDDTFKNEGQYLNEVKTGKPLIEILKNGVPEEDVFIFDNTPSLLKEFGEYCITDVDTEMELSLALDDMPQSEIDIWITDQKMNWKGVYIDIPAVNAVLSIMDQAVTKYQDRLAEISDWYFVTAGQRDKIMDWCESKGVTLPGFTKQDVERALKKDIPPEVREVLDIRQILGRTSTAKYKAMLEKLASDGRVHEILIYHKAHTGRWGGAGIQIQNLPRPTLDDDPEFIVEILMTGDLAEVEFWFENVFEVCANAIRSMIIPAPGYMFVSADYAAIEARGLFWVADEQKGLETFRRGECIYSEMAAGIYNVTYDRVFNGYKADKMEETVMRKMGKDSVLGLGYQMGAPKFVVTCANTGTRIEKDFSEKVVKKYRKKFSNVPKMWKGIEKAAMKAMENPGLVTKFKIIKFKKKGSVLLCKLPSGRMLHYPDAHLEYVTTDWGQEKLQLHYGTFSDGHWITTHTYGGKLTENIIQAISRDIMAEALIRLDKHGYTPVMSIHDESVSEVPDDGPSIEEYCKIMCELPDWAKGLPLKAEGWVGYRYRK